MFASMFKLLCLDIICRLFSSLCYVFSQIVGPHALILFDILIFCFIISKLVLGVQIYYDILIRIFTIMLLLQEIRAVKY